MKRIEKRFNKIDNALELGEATLGEAMREDQEKDKIVQTKFDRLCPTFFKLGKCLEGPSCTCAHQLSDLSGTYMPNEWVNYFKANTNRVKSAHPETKFRQAFDQKSVNVDKIVNNKGQTLLLEACETCSVTMAKMLLDKGADPNVTDWRGLNGLCYALKKDCFDLVFALLKQTQYKIDLNRYVEKFKSSYLIAAIKTCSVRLVRLLLDEGADPNSVDKHHKNGLVFSIERNEEASLKLLLARGTEVNNLDLDKQDPLQVAMDADHIAFIKLLLRAGASTATSKKRGVQLIMTACDYGDLDFFDILIEKGVSWHSLDEAGRNVAMRAYLAKQISLADRLLTVYNFKTQVNARDKKGETLLTLAIRQEDLAFVTSLLVTCDQIQIDLRNEEGKTPLLLAAELNLTAIVILLAGRMTSTMLNMADLAKNTSLIWAVRYNNLNAIRSLLANKDIDTTCKDALDKSPYDYAQSDEVRQLIYSHQMESKGSEAEIRVVRDMVRRVAAKNRQSHL